MKYKKWINETDIRKPEIGDFCHCVLIDKQGELPPYQEILIFTKDGFREQYERTNHDDIERFRIVYWRSCPDFPDLKEMNERANRLQKQ